MAGTWLLAHTYSSFGLFGVVIGHRGATVQFIDFGTVALSLPASTAIVAAFT